LSTYVAFLRAINVGGHALVKMDALCGAFTAAGCRHVRSYIQSGNVIFESSLSEQGIHRKLQAKLGTLLETEPGIFLRTFDEISELVKRDPFAKFHDDPGVTLYIAFLAERPSVKPRFPLHYPKEGLEFFGMNGREAFIASRPVPRSHGVPIKLIEKELQVSATTRNWNTVVKIVKFAQTEQPNKVDESS
jgi:uncharacterized protein (DUF1697 family)